MKRSSRGNGIAQLEVLTGSRGGERRTLVGEYFTVGRDPESDLQLDPDVDLAVSGRHAQFSFQDGRWFLSDLGSLNGTILNGERITGPVPLHHEARIQFGEDGPIVVFRTRSKDGASPLGAWLKHSWLPLGLIALLSAALVAVGAVALRSRSEGRRYAQQISAMQQEIDSVLRASERTAAELRGWNESLAEALSRSREDLRVVRTELEHAQRRGDPGEIEVLRVQLQEAQAALGRHQLAAAIDHEAIERANRRAVVKVFVTLREETVTGTAFSVRSDGVLLTNRHLLTDRDGTVRPQRIDVQFADSDDYFPARIVAVSQAEDLAALRVDLILGDVPTISDFNQRPDTVSTGEAVVVIGFPRGGADPAREGRGGIARPTITAGILGFVSDTVLSVYGYGAEGASGSPVFDGDGKVIGVVFGGRQGAGEHMLDAVPIRRAVHLLQRVY